MFGADKGNTGPLDGKTLHIGVVQARFNEGITNALAAACVDELTQRGVPAHHIHHVTVPGALEVGRAMHSWTLENTLRHMAEVGQGVVVLLNCGESAAQLLAQFDGTARSAYAPERGRMDLRNYGVGAQILRECGVHKMQLLGNPRRMPSMAGYGLEVTGFLSKNPEGK